MNKTKTIIFSFLIFVLFQYGLLKNAEIMFSKKIDCKKNEMNVIVNEIIEVKGSIGDSIIIESENIYFFTNNNGFSYYKLNMNEKKELWRFENDNKNTGIFKSGIIDGENLYFGSNQGNIYAINLETGISIWNYKNNYSITSTPKIFDEIIYYSDYEGNIIGLDSKTGKLMFKEKMKATKCFNSYFIDDNIYLYSNNGMNIISYNIVNKKINWEIINKNYFISKPIKYKDDLYISSNDCYIYKIRIKDGAMEKYYFTSDSHVEGILLNSDILYYSAFNYIFSYSITNKKTLWNVKLDDISWSTLELFDKYIIYDDLMGDFYIIDNKLGNILFKRKFKSRITTKKVIDKNNIIIGTNEGKLYLIKIIENNINE